MHAKLLEPDSDKQHRSCADLDSENCGPHASQGMGSSVQGGGTASGPVEIQQKATQAKDVTRPRKAHHMRSRSDIVQQHHAMTRCRDMKLSPSFPSHLSKSLKTRRSLLDDGSRIIPPTECFFPQPQKGQSLTSFLSSSEFSNCAELDKENAHFYVSEALISAMEQMRWRKAVYGQSDGEAEESEVEDIKQRIRIRRREKVQEKISRPLELQLSDGLTDTPTSISPASSFNSSTSCREGESDTDIEDFDLSENRTTNLSLVPEQGLSLSMASLYSDTDIKKLSQDSGSTEVLNKLTPSAEVVALSLLKKFSEKHLPKASELVWLVSERDAPQSLLPLPDSWPISPDEAFDEYDVPKTRLRGNLEWAPPREQIILSVRTKPRLRMQLAAQNYRCAGCGMKVSQALASGLRYCEYLSKLFCHCCHNNSTAVIPARVLHQWDFGRYPVSKFAHDLLERLSADPLFHVQDLNPSLYRRSNSMNRVRQYRLALHHLQQFVQACRHAVVLQDELEKLPHYLLSDPDVYSLEDLQQVRSGALVESLKKIWQSCLNHCTQCARCCAQGFICEGCHNGKDILFPYQLSSTFQCPACRACFHHKCYVPGHCPKCLRLENRRKTWAHMEYASS
ncbi:run domain Beclin-1-interacting and cysteine-rich domain-containing protein-like isoform X2 [Ornithodoros turicata]|uniref:run domain Beclin-1-interacting and cysteine-rich domain-containing protein-like isoform X2 n=1 Tax=Ornithodoros turicata TaxID=34597 RepID=UPI003138C7AB